MKIDSFTDAVKEILAEKFSRIADELRTKHAQNFLKDLDKELAKISAETYFIVQENLPNKDAHEVNLIIRLNRETK